MTIALLLAACSLGHFSDDTPPESASPAGDSAGPAGSDGAAMDGGGDGGASPDGGGADGGGRDGGGTADGGGDGGSSIDCPYSSADQPDDRSLSTNVSGRVEHTGIDGYTDSYLYDETEYLKIGVRQDWGGSIVFFGLTDGSAGVNSTNTIDANDTGREVQVAFYDPDRAMQGCAWNASCQSFPTPCPESITYLGWNPVQGGNRCNNGSGVDAITELSEGGLQLVTTPLFWNPDWESTTCSNDGCDDPSTSSLRSDVEVQQTLRFARTHVVELRTTLTELGGLDHAATYQEMPTVYTSNGVGGPDLWRLLLSDGTEVSIDTPGNDGFYYENVTSPDPWVTLQDDAGDYGVGILYENGVVDFQGWQNRDLPFNNVRALFSFGIPAYGTVNARAYLIIGSFDTIAGEAAAVMADAAPFGVLDTPADGDSATGRVDVSGWALDNRGVASVVARLDESAEQALTYGSSRPDVAVAWPGYPAGDAGGFVGQIDLSAVDDGSGCPHLVEIVATDTDGNSRTIDRALVSVAR